MQRFIVVVDSFYLVDDLLRVYRRSFLFGLFGTRFSFFHGDGLIGVWVALHFSDLAVSHELL